jgi:F-type H+-transporting ATPase subunit alpha
LDQAQYRELEAFSKFGSDLDAATKAVLAKGARNVEILKQGQFSPLRVEQQVAIIYLGSKGLLTSVPINKVREFESEFLSFLENKHKDVLNTLKKGGIGDDVTSVLEKVCKELTAKYSA